ncbi:hypothetical protein [Streptomyces liangshanensis]|uniref:hypothetical protein n=1 Tax=Streptomyces liangshanensis TaxID=2717324 RepID=UPI0036D92056
MPWDELKQALTAQKAAYTTGDPLWTVRGPNGEPFRAHPAFLDEVRLAGELDGLVTATDSQLSNALRKWRVTLDRHLAAVPDARAALGLGPQRFTTLEDEITLLRYYETARSQPGFANPVVAAAGTAFADHRQAATVHDYSQLHAFFLAAVNSFGGAYKADTYPARVNAMYDLAVGSPAAVGAGPVQLGAEADWRTHQPGFALTIHAEAARFNFRTAHALAGHALKHLLLGGPPVPADRDGVHHLVGTYLDEARGRISVTGTAPSMPEVSSALAQTGATRTYRYGILNVHATMVAVNPTGQAWITTYYGPTRT